MLNLFKKPVIEFYCHPSLEGVIPEPKSAAKYFPDWFKKIPQDLPRRDIFKNPVMTAKKCMPLLDAMSFGYIIPLAGDTRVITNDNLSIIDIHSPPQLKTIDFHETDQVGGKTYPGYPGKPIKFINHWVIKTAPGWSTLFVPMLNNFEQPFTCLSGLVDTDKYPKEVNFPAVWHEKNFDGSLVAGTPLVTVIPVKRSSFPKKPVVRKMTDKEFNEIDKMSKIQNSRSHYYTNELREPR